MSGRNTHPTGTLITGGAGFIGTNLAHCLLGAGESVLVFDNLSRPHVTRNLHWLRKNHGDRLSVRVADVRDKAALADALSSVARVFHFAGQVAVTNSLEQPLDDFEVNALGTMRLLEAIRESAHRPSLVFTSTNKVYGGLASMTFQREDRRYLPVDVTTRRHGVSEGQPLDFQSPYGCSKGAADQYVLDYVRSFDLRAVVLRMSCIYGPRQFGSEDQGWVAHFLIRAATREKITIYGDGMQVRDVLFVDDLVDALRAVDRAMPSVAGQAFNVGGGPSNTLSLLELLDEIAELAGGRAPHVEFAPWRTADQKYYVSDHRKLSAATGWRPQVGVRDGVRRLHRWIREIDDATGGG